MALKTISLNCQSAKANVGLISRLLNKCDILCLQETLLSEDNINILENISDDFSTVHIPSIRKQGNFYGRSSGGLAILWRNNNDYKFFPVYCNSRCLGIKMYSGENVYLLLNVYLNCDYGNQESLIKYKENLAEIANFISFDNYDDLILTGDLNCDPHKGRFFNEFKLFMDTFDLKCKDIDNLPIDSYTYISSNLNCSTSWIDHTIVSNSSITDNHSIMYGTTFYDHIPIMFDIILPCIYTPMNHCRSKYNSKPIVYYDWNRATDLNLEEYCEFLETLSDDIMQNHLFCRKNNCSIDGHRIEISNTYDKIIDCIEIASSILPSNNKIHSSRIVGWNDFCKKLHNDARDAFLKWNSNGKIRSGELFETMKHTRLKFKDALNYCKKNETIIKRKNFLKFYLDGNKKLFWKEIKKINRKKYASTINGSSDDREIVELFTNKFKEQFLEVNSAVPSEAESANTVATPYLGHVPLDIDTAIKRLKNGLSFDGLHTLHVKNSGPKFRKLLNLFYSYMMNHNFIPNQMLHGELRPIIKNNKICKTRLDNYRPIMNSSILLKIFEYCLMPYLDKELKPNDQQMGFRQNSSCIDTVMLLKEIVSNYNNEGSNVHCSLIDLSKAFDKIDHDIMVNKLKDSGLPCKIVDILEYMIKNTWVHVNYNSTVGNVWKIETGTRQGGVLSPILFNYYIKTSIDDVIKENAGCMLNGIKWNVLAYADDILIMAPSSNGLQSLIDKFGISIMNVKLTVNVDKSKYIVFKKSKNDNIESSIYLYGEQLKRVYECKYLGIILDENKMNKKDSDRLMSDFLIQFNSLYQKFSFTSSNVLHFLFKTYASSFYGVELWYNDKNRKKLLHNISVSYHKAVKRIAHLNVWDSNHLACEIVRVNIFKHLQAKRMYKYCWSLMNSKNSTLKKLKYYINFSSDIKRNITKIFRVEYNVIDVFDNDLDAIMSRIDFTQMNEPRLSYLNIF